MSAFSDLRDAAARVATSASAEIKAVSDKIDKLSAGSVTDTQLNEVKDSLNASAQALDDEAAKIAAIPDPATPA